MLRYDEQALVQALSALSPARRAAFALAAATRQLRCFERTAQRLRWDHAAQPRAIAEQLWETLQNETIDHVSWKSRLDLVMGWIPPVDDVDWTFEHAFVQDALIGLAYSIRSLLTADPQEAVWAAQTAYESADQASIWLLDIGLNSREAEAAILAHPVVQREFVRQAEAVEHLRADAIAQLQRISLTQTLITDEEFEVIALHRRVR